MGRVQQHLHRTCPRCHTEQRMFPSVDYSSSDSDSDTEDVIIPPYDATSSSIDAALAAMRPTSLRQELHILGQFAYGRCYDCNGEICFRCGAGSWHRGKTCREALLENTVDDRATLRFKLHHWYMIVI